MSLHGRVLTTNRGYVSLPLVKTFSEKRIRVITILPSRIIRCHLFVDRSFLVGRDDKEENEEEDEVNQEKRKEKGRHGENDSGIHSKDEVDIAQP